MDKRERSFEVSRLLGDLEHGEVSRRDFIRRSTLLGLGGSFVVAALAAAPSGVLARSTRSRAAKTVTLNAACISGINNTVTGVLIPKFEAKYPNVKVNLIVIPWTSVFQKEVLALGARSGQYDILTQSPSIFPNFAANNYYAALDTFFNEPKLINKARYDIPDFPSALWNAVGKANGHLYALPFMQFPQIMYYRSDIVKKHPRTLTEFLDSVKKTNKPPQMYGTVVQGLKAGAGGDTYAWYPYLFTFGGDVAKNGKVTLNSPAAVKALEYYIELFKYAPQSSITYGSDQSDVPFLQGRVAQTLENSDHFARFVDPTQSTVAKKTTFDVMPGLHAGEQGTVMAGCWSYGVSHFSSNQPEAFQFITYITSKEAMSAYVTAGGLPPRTSTMTSPAYAKKYPVFSWVNKAGQHAKGIPPLKNYLAVETALEDAIDFAVTGQKSAKAALDEVQAKFAK
jgi:multiple sugar transport system substrate-binding protein